MKAVACEDEAEAAMVDLINAAEVNASAATHAVGMQQGRRSGCRSGCDVLPFPHQPRLGGLDAGLHSAPVLAAAVVVPGPPLWMRSSIT